MTWDWAEMLLDLNASFPIQVTAHGPGLTRHRQSLAEAPALDLLPFPYHGETTFPAIGNSLLSHGVTHSHHAHVPPARKLLATGPCVLPAFPSC